MRFIPYPGKCSDCARRRQIVTSHPSMNVGGRPMCRPCDRAYVDRLNALFPSWPRINYAA